jgi:hypothetical protein
VFGSRGGGGDGGGHQDLADEALGGHALLDVGHRPALDGGIAHPVAGEVRHHDDAGAGRPLAQLGQHVQPRSTGHGQVEEDEVRVVLDGHRQCRHGVDRFDDRADPLACEERAHDQSLVGVVVHDQGADRIHLRSPRRVRCGRGG